MTTNTTDLTSSSTASVWNATINESIQNPAPKPWCMTINLSTFQFHDEAKDKMSMEVSSLFNNILHIAFYPLLFLLGFPTNLVNMAVFFKHGLKRRINLCLFCLSVLDLVYVILSFLMYAEKLQHIDFNISYRAFGHVPAFLVNKKLLGFYSGSVLSSQFLSAVIAGERCLCVAWPLRVNQMLKPKTLAAVLAVGVFLITGGRFVVGMKYYMICATDAGTGLTSYFVVSSEFYKTYQKTVDIVDGLVYSLGLNITLCTFIIITTVITAVNLQKSTEFQKDSSTSASASSAGNVAVTKMVIYLSIQFILLNTPNMLFRLSLLALPELTPSGNWANLFFFLSAIPELFGLLSSTLNFVIYFFFGSKYRQSVFELFCRNENMILSPRQKRSRLSQR